MGDAAAEVERTEDVHMMADDDMDGCPAAIEKLQSVGIGMPDITKLKLAGYFTVMSLQLKHPKALKQIKGFSEAKVEKVLEAARKLTQGSSSFSTASAYLESRQDIFAINTGARELNEIIGGGLESQQLTEVHGEYRTGKTQLCMTLSISAQVPSADGVYTGGKVIYIDTEGAFQPERLEGICTRFNVDYRAALDNIFFCRVYNSDQLISVMKDVSGILAQEQGVVKLLIVDSIMATFRSDYCGRGELSERQQVLNQLLTTIKCLSCEWNIAVLMTNQMQSDPGGGMTFVSDPKKPIGGHILAHQMHTRLMLRKGSGDQRYAKLVCSSRMPERDGSFRLAEGGVCDCD